MRWWHARQKLHTVICSPTSMNKLVHCNHTQLCPIMRQLYGMPGKVCGRRRLWMRAGSTIARRWRSKHPWSPNLWQSRKAHAPQRTYIIRSCAFHFYRLNTSSRLSICCETKLWHSIRIFSIASFATFTCNGFERYSNLIQFQLFLFWLIQFAFIHYSKEGPEKISVYGRNSRTNNSVEAYNAALNKLIHAKGNFYQFCLILQFEEFNKYTTLQLLLESGGTAGETVARSVLLHLMFFNCIYTNSFLFLGSWWLHHGSNSRTKWEQNFASGLHYSCRFQGAFIGNVRFHIHDKAHFGRIHIGLGRKCGHRCWWRRRNSSTGRNGVHMWCMQMCHAGRFVHEMRSSCDVRGLLWSVHRIETTATSARQWRRRFRPSAIHFSVHRMPLYSHSRRSQTHFPTLILLIHYLQLRKHAGRRCNY